MGSTHTKKKTRKKNTRGDTPPPTQEQSKLTLHFTRAGSSEDFGRCMPTYSGKPLKLKGVRMTETLLLVEENYDVTSPVASTETASHAFHLI